MWLPAWLAAVGVFAFVTYTAALVLRLRYGVYVVGLSGGIASGKSTVTSHLRARGAHVIDLDAVVRATQESAPVLAALKKTFGNGVVSEDGKLDRKALGALVFGATPAHKTALRQLNGLMRVPIIKATAAALLSAIFVDGHRWVVLDVPLLFERGYQHICAETCLVYVSPETQLKRLMVRDQASHTDAEARINAQWSLEKKRPLATHVLVNEDDGLEQLHAQVESWMKASQQRARVDHASALVTPPTRIALFLGAVVAVVPALLVLARPLFVRSK